MAINIISNKTSLDFAPLAFLVGVLTIPFFLTFRFHPNMSFFIDSAAIILSLLMVIILSLQGKTIQAMPRTSWFFIVLAVLWYIQTLLLPIKFVGQSYFTIGVFLSMAMLAFAIQALIQRFGRQNIMILVASALMIGALLQASIGLLQLLDLTKNLNQILNTYSMNLDNIFLVPRKNTIYGQLAQPNHFAHYLMWGLASTIYLFSIKKIRWIFAIAITAFLSFFLAVSASRAVLLYVVVFIVLALIWFFRERNTAETKRILALVFIATVLIFAFQSSTVLQLMDVQSVNTGLSRATGGAQASGNFFLGSRRSYEWYKAWLIFSEHPFFGVGWTQYVSAAFQLDMLPVFDTEPKEAGLFNHSHNSLLQLLAEMGGLCTLVIVIGLAYLVMPYLKEKATPDSLLPIMLIGVSLTHSMVEFPLWYVYFLAPFTIFLSLQNKSPLAYDAIRCTSFLQTRKAYLISAMFVFIASFALLIKTSLLFITYLEIKDVYQMRNMEANLPQIQSTTLPLIENNSFFAFEAVYTLEMTYAMNDKTFSIPVPERTQVNKQLVEYRPYSYPMLRRAMYLSMDNNIPEALTVLKSTDHYYVVLMSEFISTLNARSDDFPVLLEQIYLDCQNLKKRRLNLDCTKRPRPKKKKVTAIVSDGLLEQLEKVNNF